jgi:hypothetical protein
MALVTCGAILHLVGLTVVLWFARGLSTLDRRIFLCSAPLWGISVLALISSWSHALSVSPWLWVAILLAASSVALIGAVRGTVGSRRVIADLAISLIPLLVLIVVNLPFNARDLRAVGIEQYFPLTNADTFNYLGLVERIYQTGSYWPGLSYPSGISVRIEHAIPIRFSAAFIVASLTGVLQWEPEESFFLSLRLGFVLAQLGAILLTFLVTRSLLTVLSIGTLTIGTNLLLNQVLQQFLSSTLGLSQLFAVMLASVLAIRSAMQTRFVVLAGASAGTYALTSPESHPFVLIAMLSILFAWGTLKVARPVRTTLCFIAAYAFVIVPWGPTYFYALLGQLPSTVNHPGDFFASPGVLTYAAGIALWDGRALVDYKLAEQVTSVLMVLCYFAGAIVCLSVAIWHRRLSTGDRQVALLLGTTASVVIGAQSFAYLKGMGFLLSKLIDYFSILSLVVVAVALTYAIEWSLACASPSGRGRVQGAIRAFTFAMVVGYVAIALPHKRSTFAHYADIVRNAPPREQYVLGSDTLDVATGVWADVGYDINMRFLWENRWRQIPLYVAPDLGGRYSSHLPIGSVSHVVQMSGPAVGTSHAVDINRPRDIDTNSKVHVVASEKYLKIVEGRGWLGAEGADSSDAWRWLSGAGDFVILACTSDVELTMELTSGPDMHVENVVEVHIAGIRARVAGGSELGSRPVTRTVPLHNTCVPGPTYGTVVVTGPKSGIRQVRVGALHVVAGKR